MKQPIIDMHQHAQEIYKMPDGNQIPIPTYVEGVENDVSRAATTEALLQVTLEEMDEHNIVKAFVSGTFEHIYQWAKNAPDPDRFIISPCIFGNDIDPSVDYLREEYEAGRIAAIGEIAAQYVGMAPNDPYLAPYYALAAELDVPILTHTLGIGAPNPGFRCQAGRPLLLEDVLVKHPTLRLFVESAGYPFLGDMIALMYQYPQVYADLSTISWILPRPTFHDYVHSLIKADLGHRLLFGSDQMAWPETISMAIDGIETADFLTDKQKRDIFYNNAVRFLRLDAD